MCCGTLVAVGESKKQLKEPGTIFFKKIKKTEEKEKEKRKRKKPTKTNKSNPPPFVPMITTTRSEIHLAQTTSSGAGHSCLSQSRCHRGPRQRPAQSHRGAYDLVEEGYSLPENGLDLVDV